MAERVLKGYYRQPTASPPERGVSDIDHESIERNGTTSSIPQVTQRVIDPKHGQIDRMVRLYNTNLDVFRAVDIFSNWFASLPLTVVKQTKDDEETLHPTLDYPLNYLSKGNFRQSGFVLRKQVAMWYLLARISYLAFRFDPNGTGLQFEVLDPRKVLRVPGKDRQIEFYVYYDQSVPGQAPVIYEADFVIELTVDGFGTEPYSISTPPSEIFADTALGRSSKDSLVRRAKQQGQKMGVINTGNAAAIRDSLRRERPGASPYIFLDVDEEFKPIDALSKDAVEADLMARTEATREIFAAMKTPAEMKNLDKKDAQKLEKIVALWLRTDVIPLLQMFCGQVTSRLCVGRNQNRVVQVQEKSILELAPLHVEAIRAMVARINSGVTTVAEERASAAMDKQSMPEGFDQYDFVSDVTKPVLDLIAAEKRAAGKPGPAGGNSDPSVSLPGTLGGRQQRNEGHMIDETGQKG